MFHVNKAFEIDLTISLLPRLPQFEVFSHRLGRRRGSYTQKSVKHLRWSVLRKSFRAESRYLFPQNALS